MLDMEQTIQSKEFRLLTKGLRTIFTILMVLMIFALTMIGVLLVAVFIVTEKEVHNILVHGQIAASIHLGGLKIELANQVANDFHFSKWNVLKLLFTATIYIALLLFIVVQVRNVLSNLSKGIIFSGTNSRKMEWIAYAIVFLSLTVGAFRTYVTYTIFEQFKLAELLVETGLIKGVAYQFTGVNWTLLLCGLVIWTIARVFRYGAFLQDEYDATA